MSGVAESVELITPAADAVVSLKSSEQQAFYTDKHRWEPHEADPEPNGCDQSSAWPVFFKWRAEGIAELRIARTPDMREFCSWNGLQQLRIYNLLPGTVYYYQVCCGGKQSAVRRFTTADELPRCINMPEVTNVRDCGGWSLGDHRQYKFNMLYRGGQLEPWTVLSHGCGINAEGEKVWQSLGIKSELDLRHDGAACCISGQVNYCKIPSTAYAAWQEQGIFGAEAMKQIRRIFEFLGNEDVYPVYLHCQGGGDRTGTLAFLLGAMLGMSYDDLLTDYEFSNLSVSGERSRYSTVWHGFMAKLRSFAPDGSLQMQVKNYLNCCGVDDLLQQKITCILTEEGRAR